MSKNTVSYLVSLTQSFGVELNFYLVLDQKPTRQEQKLKTLNQYVQQYPSGWKKRLELANLLYAIGQWERAVEEYRQVIERQPLLIEVWLKLGKILQLIGQDSEAIAVYESALPIAQNEPTRQHIRGAIAVCIGDSQGAIAAFESAATFEPDNVAHWLALGQIHMGREDAIAALRAFDAVLSLDSDDIIALINSYDALMALGNVREAGRRLSKVGELAPDDFRLLKRQIDNRCRMRLVFDDEGKQTKQMISYALRLAPGAAAIHELLAYYHLFRGEWAKGVRVLAKFTQEHPNNPSGWYYYGRCLFHTGEYQQGVQAMLKVYYLYPKDREIYRALCEILLAVEMTFPPEPLLGRERENTILASVVEEMLERFAEHWSVWATAGRVLVEGFQEIERGCSVSGRGTQLQPNLADSWFRHGRVLALAGKHQEAVEALSQGCQLLLEAGSYLPSVSAAVWLGESYRVLGNDAASRQWWQEACQLTKELMELDPAMACYWQGRALEGLEDVSGAIEAYRSALSQQLLYPARGEVQEALKRLSPKAQKGSGS
ncbi:MAG: tetratricopeptide repeat protein [Nostoc sp. ZfuVER08]|nr:tetratricopeptide repeat protein [Nostoc sp. ZfuVER08]